MIPDSTKQALVQSAREMRRKPTPAEEKLWAALRGKGLTGLKFRRQHVVGSFIADFYCASARLVVEVDGGIHDLQVDDDAARTRQLADYGYRIIRFRNDQVLNALEDVLTQIVAAALNP